MTAETLAIGLVVLVGATVASMVKEFFTKPWHLQEDVVVVDGRAYQQVTYAQMQPVLGQPQYLPLQLEQARIPETVNEKPSWLDSESRLVLAPAKSA